MIDESFRDISNFQDYRSDESNLIGNASTISFPHTDEEIVETCKYCYAHRIPMTLSGARTGITGGAVPDGGHVISLIDKKRILGISFDKASSFYAISAEPGLSLKELRERISAKELDTEEWSRESLAAFDRFKADVDFFFPPDPTETTASIGGMVSSNSSGARSFMYGSVRKYVRGLRLILADGRIVRLRRGEYFASGSDFSIAALDGTLIPGTLPSYRAIKVKNASGYYSRENMDLVDLFIGSEGTLGIVTEIELALVRKPLEMLGVYSFFKSDDDAIRFVKMVRGDTGEKVERLPVALEFFDSDALRFLSTVKQEQEAFRNLPRIPKGAGACVYAEYHTSGVSEIDDAMIALSVFIAESGGDENSTWIASGEKEIESLGAMRHALPEAVNMYVRKMKNEFPDITKLGTDMSVPNERLAEMYGCYRESLAQENLASVIFGHIGDNHLHVNILPRTMPEYERGKEIYLEWAKKAVSFGGSVSAEHGIGKLKRDFLLLMYGEKGVDEMKRCKKAFDPEFLLNRGNLFEP
jgi:D-lactate dehydrogenase (cytochrome)